MATYKELKLVKYLDGAISFVEELLDITFKPAGKNTFSAYCRFHIDSQPSFRAYADKKGEVRFHCFGECSGDWDVYDLIMTKNKCNFKEAQKVFAQYLGVEDFKAYTQHDKDRSDLNQLEEPDEPVVRAEPKELDLKMVGTLDLAASYYNELLLKDPDRFKKIFAYLKRRGLDTDTIRKFNIGYAQPFKDDDYVGRALIKEFLDMFKDDFTEFYSFQKAGLVRLLNDGTYYTRYVDFSKEWGPYGVYADCFAGYITFPIYNAHGKPHGFMGRRPDNRGNVRWRKQKTEDTFISTRGWLYGIDKASRHIRHYKTVILVEGIFDYFAFYNLFQDTDKPIVVSTLGTMLTDETLALLRTLGVEHYIIAYDCDNAGRKAIQGIADEVGGIVYYLGEMADGEDPSDKLKPVGTVISGFSLKHLISGRRHRKRQKSPSTFLTSAKERFSWLLTSEWKAKLSLRDQRSKIIITMWRTFCRCLPMTTETSQPWTPTFRNSSNG